jgi:hypothetical protein
VEKCFLSAPNRARAILFSLAHWRRLAVEPDYQRLSRSSLKLAASGDVKKPDIKNREKIMGLQNEKISALSFVTADLNYLTPATGRPQTYTFDPPSGEPRSNIVPEPHALPIYDVRPISDSVSLDREGFALVRQRSALNDFYDEDEVKSVYYSEAERILKAVTGADRVFVFDHTVRKRIEGAADLRNGGPRQPVARVHVDHTARSGPQRVRDLIPDEADELLKGRVQIINLWRPIHGPLKDSPLAVCDARTVKFDELVGSDLVYPHRVGETYSVKYSPEHRWFYVPDMTPDEVLLLKCFDSKADGTARFAPHSAFADPTTPNDASPRESIELRTLVFHAA